LLLGHIANKFTGLNAKYTALPLANHGPSVPAKKLEDPIPCAKELERIYGRADR